MKYGIQKVKKSRLQKAKQKMTDIWEKTCKLFFLLNSIMQVVTGLGLGLLITVALVTSKTQPPPEPIMLIVTMLSAFSLLCLTVGTMYSVLFVIFMEEDRIFHYVWTVALAVSFLVVREWGLPETDWDNLFFLSYSWVAAFCLDRILPFMQLVIEMSHRSEDETPDSSS